MGREVPIDEEYRDQLERIAAAAARVRHTREQGQSIAHYDAWQEMCAVLDALKGLNPDAR